MGKLLNYLGESKILKRIADVLNVKDVKVNDVSVVDNNGDANITIPAQIQSDWDQTDNTQPDYIKNKPSTPAAQVQSDWNEDDTTDPAYIKNKPTIPDELADLQDDSTHRVVTDTQISGWDAKADMSDIPTDFVPKSTGGTFDANVNIITKHTQTTNVNSVISLGNNIPLGTEGTSRGILQLWSNTGKWVNFIPDLNPANVSLSLPMITGTLALTSDSVINILGAKNILPYPPATKSGNTVRGITFSYGHEGYITLNGTANASQQPYFQYSNNTTKSVILESGQRYTLSVDGLDNRIWGIVYFKNLDGTSASISTNAIYEDGTTRNNSSSDYVSLNYSSNLHTSVSFTITTPGTYVAQVDLRVSAGSGTYTNAQARLMFSVGTNPDSIWRPYAETNKQLTDNKMSWKNNSILGSKNLVAYPYVNASGHNPRGSIVFTYNEEGYISVNGTNTTQNSADFTFYNAYTSDFLLESGKEYILSLERTNDLIYGLLYFKDASGNNLTLNYSVEYEDGSFENRNTYYVSLNRDIYHTIAKFKILDDDIKCYSELRMRIGAGLGPFDSATDKGRFMLRVADDNDDTWQPYSMTNQELTKVVRGVPTTAGTYTLQATRNADNSITYSWV